MFEYIYAQLKNLLDARGDAWRLTGKDGYIRNEFLRRMSLENIDELDQKLDSWCGFIPVEISKEEFERTSDLCERTVENRSGGFYTFLDCPGELFDAQNNVEANQLANMSHLGAMAHSDAVCITGCDDLG